eukprot:TRINITY_DN81960_c0_g1_i1.p1 TRINITY_DN81960_c0_g1~~TRINITY_DN81960_c0_g1_i1.p1  ORF type:complete len:304 (-),score=80.40 TRINITY_DN81960_c0_g1_i1:624-1490(-)
MEGIMDWYFRIPVVTRIYFTISMLLSLLVTLDMLSPFSLYLNKHLVLEGEVWRLITNFMFFGEVRLDLVFHMFFLVRYMGHLEEGSFFNRTDDFLFLCLYGMVGTLIISWFLSLSLLGPALVFMFVYIWARRNEFVRMNFFGTFTVNAPYIPYVLVAFSFFLGGPITADLVGIAVGHVYYFCKDVYPKLAEIRGWERKDILPTWKIVSIICGMRQQREEEEAQRLQREREAQEPQEAPVAAEDGEEEIIEVNFEDEARPQEQHEQEQQQPEIEEQQVAVEEVVEEEGL